MQTVDLRDIAFETINDDYSWGNYIDFKVIIMRKNGYINVTKLSDEGGKRFKEWTRNKIADELQNEVSALAGIPANELLLTPKNVSNDLRGTYAHPDLVPHIAAWISPKFGVRVSRIVNSYAVKQERDRQEAEKAKMEAEKLALAIKNGELTEKNMTLTQKLEAFRLEMNQRHDEYMRKVDNTLNKLDDANNKLDTANNELRDMNNTLGTVTEVSNTINERLEVVEEKLDNVKANVVPIAQQSGVMEMFVLLKQTDYDPKTEYQYYTVCGQAKYVKNTRARLIKKDNMEEILCIEYTPNTKNLLHRMKEDLKDSISYYGNKIDLKDTMNETEFIAAINKINDEKFETCEV